VNSAGKFNLIVDKTLKPVLCSSRDGVPLKFKKQLGDTLVYQCGLFEPDSTPVKSRWTIPLREDRGRYGKRNTGRNREKNRGRHTRID
jgi:hypothetical protein